MEKQIVVVWTDLHQELKKFVLSKVKNEDTCNDLIQDIFVKIQLNLHTLNDCSKLTSWVYQITRNVVTDHFRKATLDIGLDSFDIAEDDSEEPLYQSLSNCINSKIRLLPAKYKQAILLTTFGNFSQLGLAKELNISYSGAKTRIQRAREKLKDLITDCENVETGSNGKLIA
jgi:RNA polymerase sigma-70 factor (ECF subfamily)